MTPKTGLARALSKLGFCSRSKAFEIIRAGRVKINGHTIRDPERAVRLHHDVVSVDEEHLATAEPVYLMLNKPRGLVTTASDEHGRATIFSLLKDPTLPAHLSAVGRLDKASEGLLLISNDTSWANQITDPRSHLPKTYHVQVATKISPEHIAQFAHGISSESGLLRLPETRVLREGEKNTWLEIILTEGKNRHIRRVLEALKIEVLRLIRIEIGPLPLGTLPKGQWRHLTPGEVEQISTHARQPASKL